MQIHTITCLMFDLFLPRALDLIYFARQNILVINSKVIEIEMNVNKMGFLVYRCTLIVCRGFLKYYDSVLFRGIVSLHKTTREVLTTRVVDIL